MEMGNIKPIVSWGFLALFVSIVALIQDYSRFDLAITQWIQENLLSSFEDIAQTLHRFGTTTWGLIEIVLVACIFLIGKEWSKAGLAVTLVVPNLAAKMLKSLIARPRPDAGLVYVAVDSVSGYSFPSGHMVHFTLLFGFILYFGLLPRVTGVVRILILASTGLILTCIGLSRVLLGVHWPSDVIGGAIWACTFLSVMIYFDRQIIAKLGKK